MVLDPSGFTLPYDFLLLEGLAPSLDETLFVTRSPRRNPAESYPQIEGAGIAEWFYPLAEGVRRRVDRAAVYGPIKAIEHYVGWRRVMREARARSIDVVHVQWLVLPAIDQRFVRRLTALGIPTVHTVHDTQPFHGAPTAAVQTRGWLETLQLFDALIVHTEQSRRVLMELGIDSQRIEVIAHGVIPLGSEAPPPAPSRSYEGGDRVTLLFFGLIKPYKGVDVLLEAYSRLAPDVRRNACLRIAGNPINVDEDLHDAVRRLGIADSVELDLRFIPDAEVPALLSDADVLVFPYRTIDASGIFMSALPYGKPIVASDVGMFAEYVNDGVDGRLVPAGSVDALTDALAALLSDRAALSAYSQAASRRASSVPTWRAIGEQTASLYRRLVSRAS